MIKLGDHVFVSHASKDKRATKFICDALNAEGISTWVSFCNIPPGANWDESIESALTQASAVIVVVSPSSVKSRYVRTEVEQAIRTQKTVIPVIIEPTQLPLRWQMLQNVKWNSGRTKALARQIAQGLPHATASELGKALADTSRFNDVKDLILQHAEWLPIEFHMAAHYAYRTKVKILNGSQVDCFAGRIDTMGPRACLYYLGSPYHKPIKASGQPSAQFRELLDTIRIHSKFLSQGIRQTHQLAPKKFFRADRWQWKKDFGVYTVLRINVIIGRRQHYQGTAKTARQRIISEISKEMFCPVDYALGGGFEIMSYDRILETIARP